MYGIDEGLDIEFLRGEGLTQICVGEAQVILRFGDSKSISAECDMMLRSDGGPEHVIADFKTDGGPILKMLGATLTDWRVVSRKELELAFSDGHTLVLTDDSEHYEAFQINNGPDMIVV